MYFDTHTHLNVDAFSKDVEEVLMRAQEAQVSKMAIVGFDTPTIQQSLSLSETYEGLYSIIGWHPTEAGSYTSQIAYWLEEQLKHPQVVGLGEIGLDYYWMNDDPKVQERVFLEQIELAKHVHLPVSIHTREALEDTYRILKSAHIEDVGGIMHSFSGDRYWMERFLDLGMHISFSGVVTFKKATDVQEAATYVPFDKVLIETDAPYLAPVPFRGKRNEPSYVVYVAEMLAKLKNCPVDMIAKQTMDNACQLFGIDV